MFWGRGRGGGGGDGDAGRGEREERGREKGEGGGWEGNSIPFATGFFIFIIEERGVGFRGENGFYH